MREIRKIMKEDDEYPERLRNIPSAPKVLYVKGRLPRDDTPTVSIIGARDATSHGLDIAKTLASTIASHGIAIISGLAYGIDTSAHWGALDGSGETYGVLGCGLDICYPPSSYGLYSEILEHDGGLISELPPSSPPLGRHFASRNRIISGLSDAVIVIEAKSKSGTFITVSSALEQGKEVFALPGRITDRLSEGCNKLIKDGANILTSSTDILDYFDIKLKRRIDSSIKLDTISLEQRKVYDCLSHESIHIEKLAEDTNISIIHLSKILLELELLGLSESPKSGYHRRKLSIDSL